MGGRSAGPRVWECGAACRPLDAPWHLALGTLYSWEQPCANHGARHHGDRVARDRHEPWLAEPGAAREGFAGWRRRGQHARCLTTAAPRRLRCTTDCSPATTTST